MPERPPDAEPGAPDETPVSEPEPDEVEEEQPRIGVETPEADAREQAMPVPLEEDEERR